MLLLWRCTMSLARALALARLVTTPPQLVVAPEAVKSTKDGVRRTSGLSDVLSPRVEEGGVNCKHG
jgi:hypothetical protein